MIAGYTFKVPGDERVFVLTYAGRTRVWDAGDSALGMSAVEAARDLLFTRADPDQEEWGRILVERADVVWPFPYTQELMDALGVES